MERKPVASSDIKSVGYAASYQTLEIEFHSGAVYQYYNVSAGVYESLMAASSKGKYFAATIRGQYAYRRIS